MKDSVSSVGGTCQYSKITDNELLMLKGEYKFDYAVLFTCDKTSFQVLFNDQNYCLIKI